MHRLLCAAGLALLVAGCGGSDHAAGPAPKRHAAAPAPRPGDERVIRGWNRAENAGDFKRAASYFARGAIVTQDYVLQLQTRKMAIEWNSGLPCRADITFIRPERTTTLAGFHLREGLGGGCKGGGSAQVRFTIRKGLIQRWQQLVVPAQQPQGPAGSAV
jgi:hypothetical protein